MSSRFGAFKNGMIEIGLSVSCLVNCILLSIIYLVVIGLTKLFYRKKLIDLDEEPKWADLDLKNKKLEDCYKQY